MLSETLKRVLGLSVRGKTAGELARLLDRAGVRVSSIEVVQELDALHRDGMVSLDRQRRWRLRDGVNRGGGANGKPPTVGPPDGPHEEAPGTTRLTAVRAFVRLAPEPDPEPDSDLQEQSTTPPFDKLMRYYAATQRRDPRGRIEQTVDRHGVQYQLLAPAGAWWETGTTLRIAVNELPATFREALARRAENVVALGWPLAIFGEGGLPRIVPVGLFAASRMQAGDHLEIVLDTAELALNPAWVEFAARLRGWTKTALEDQFLAPTGLDQTTFRARLAESMATQIRGDLVPAKPALGLAVDQPGVHNALAVFLPTESAFTQGTARDLERLATTPRSELEETALWHLLHDTKPSEGAGVVLNPVPLTPNQLVAAEAALAGPVTAITGPPGTGKTQVILSVMFSALAQGKSVLLASRNHQAIDAVEERLAQLLPEHALLVRAKDRDGERDTDFVRVVTDIVADATPPPVVAPALGVQRLEGEARACADARQQVARNAQLNALLSYHVERWDAVAGLAVAPHRLRSGWRAWLRRRFSRRPLSLSEPLPEAATAAELEATILALRATIRRSVDAADPIPRRRAVEEGMAALGGDLVAAALAVAEPDRQRLASERADLDLDGKPDARRMSAGLARLVVRYRPFWAISTLSVPSRVPLVPGLFDYVVFDEASQCDIASAIPLLARAKAAVIVGDPHQLESIPQLSLMQERGLLSGADLPRRGMGSYVQSRNSLFGFCAARAATRRTMLRDQFRSAPEIVAYLNDAFYDGRLEALRDPATLQVPKGAQPGIAWTDVRGKAAPEPSGGARNDAEAEAIAEHLDRLLSTEDYQGTVGLITPFNAQVAALRRAIDARIPRQRQDTASLLVATVDRFQGAERDLILFSPVAATGLGVGQRTFLQRDGRRFNVAISRARAVAHVFGDLEFVRDSGIRHLQKLAERATRSRQRAGEDVFDSEWERRVDTALRARGLDPKPQYPVAGRYLDFALFGPTGVKLDLEVDGQRWHLDRDGMRKVDDLWRDRQLQSLGWRIRRFWVHELHESLEKCLDLVERDLAG